MILDLDAYMHVSMMHICMTLDPDACMYDAVMNDAYISKILYPDTCIHDAGFFPDGRTNERTNVRTNKPILGVGYHLRL